MVDLDAELIETTIRGRLGRPLRWFDSIDSTNAVAMQWAADGAPEGALVVCDHQTAGRGRWGRTWLSEAGRLLQFSLVLRPDLPPSRLGLLTAAAGLACAEGIEAVSGLRTALKWPNDVTVGARKLCGILIETRMLAGAVEAAVAGVGINVHWPRDAFPSEIAGRATSVSAELAGPAPRRVDVLAGVLAAFERLYPLATDANRSREIVSLASQRSQILGCEVRVRFSDGRSVDARASRLLEDGSLLLETAAGSEVVSVAEIEQIRSAEEPNRC